ncbi:hypothetical protein Landi51_02003 [Colletotrichum acutatum]
MKHEVLDPVDEGDNANTNLAAADIANTNNKANAPAPTSWAWLARVSTPLPTLGEHRQTHGDGHSASATGAKKPAVAVAVAAAPFGGRLRVRDPFSGRLVRVLQYLPSPRTQSWYVCEVPGCGRRFQLKISRTRHCKTYRPVTN